MPGQCGETVRGDLVVRSLEVDEGLAGGGHLPVVVAQRAAALGGDDDEDGDVQEHGQAGAVCGLIAHALQSAAQGASLLVVGTGAGVSGVVEGECGPLEFAPEVEGCMGGQGIEDFAEDRQVSLGDVVVGVVEVVGDTFCGRGGLVPRTGTATPSR